MLHTNFHGNRPGDSGIDDFLMVFTIYGHGGNLGHVTSIILTFFISMYLKAYIQTLVKNVPVFSEKSRF